MRFNQSHKTAKLDLAGSSKIFESIPLRRGILKNFPGFLILVHSVVHYASIELLS